ncbi:Octanoyltransferase [Wickerhamomyces ciferrii]|uniref:lipoyl(octanoyl) transferase n=1 Tax=Wickerhamomyces ciferrii (strain ATCC 14091 / BCRC 22168 / CBS 111 / JCM 3599 / NBRC 0793 / NRRL Y-1031 F-60-10) TaxID=1206466 RepID=K0KF91_WICCF|nr:Octanoyltransferase [Wickerhamomyces ciferrii]CCH41621.1 Octanoyltransferase [Wickerhamomyces ciferrii]
MLRLKLQQNIVTASLKRAYTTSTTTQGSSEAPKETESCTKFSPIKESAKTLRHLRFTVPFEYNKAHEIQTQFVSAFLDFKKMVSTIERSNKELISKGLESNDYEKKIIQQILDNKPSPTVLSFEFKPVFTAGQREKKRLSQESIDNLKQNTGYDFVQTDRGGEITFHNPGQVVIYPIVDLRDFKKLTIKCFVSLIEDAVIEMLRKNGIKSEKTANTGVWIDEDTKISSIGLQVRRSITFHGVSLNVSNEIPKIEESGLVFCGLPGKSQTSMKQLGVDISMADASRQLVRQIASKLGVEQVETIELDNLELHTDSPEQQ